MSGSIYTHQDLTADVERDCDVVIIGSGAGGSVLAAELCRAGLSVVMLEEGNYLTRKDFTLHEQQAYPALYQERGTRGTADLAITVLQGRSVGGSTTVNWTTCYRTPDRILKHWEQVHRIEGLDAATLSPHFDAVEERLNIQPWPRGAVNDNNRVVLEGCEKLGWSSKTVSRNVKGCANTGYCSLGCPVDGKQAMGITYIPDAVADGLELFANVRAETIEVQDNRVVAVHARVMKPDDGSPTGPKVTIRPKVAVSSGGAINGPVLLLKSGITSGGLVGRRTFLHPVVAMLGVFEKVMNPFYGAPQSAASHQFIDRGSDKVGFFIEVAPLQPMLAAVAFNMFGDVLGEKMAKLPHANGMISLSVDGLLPQDDGGTVTVRPDGRPSVDYPIRPFLQESFRASHIAMAKIQLAAGASLSGSLHGHNVLIQDESDLAALERAPYGAHEHAIFTAHQMGGCTMGNTPETSVVNNQHQHWQIPNLFVVDGSVLPTALGVNPSQTIYALARRAARFVGEAV